MVDKRTNYAKDIMESVRKNYEGILTVYESVIPIPLRLQSPVLWESAYILMQTTAKYQMHIEN